MWVNIFFACGYPIFPEILIEETILFHCVFFVPPLKISCHICVCFFLGHLFGACRLRVCFYASTILFWMPLVCNIIGNQEVWCLKSALYSFPKIALALLGFLWFHTNFSILFSISFKNAFGISGGLCWLCR